MRKGWPLMLALLLLNGPAHAELVRDWTVERPMLAGFLSGLSLLICTGCQLGRQSETAEPGDPFAMTPLVRQQLLELDRRPYRTGQLFGAGCTIFLIRGFFMRRLNRLKVRELTG